MAAAENIVNMYSDTYTRLVESDINIFEDTNAKLAIIKDCNITDRWAKWTTKGPLKDSKYMGCGFNTLVFLQEMSRRRGDIEVQKLIQPDSKFHISGLGIDNIVNYFNSKSQDNKPEEQRVYFTRYDYPIVVYTKPMGTFTLDNEPIDEDATRRNIYKFYKDMYTYLPVNCCMLLKMGRFRTDMASGHTVSITKTESSDDNGNLREQIYVVDPQSPHKEPTFINIYKWDMEHPGMCSKGTYNALIGPNGLYRYMSVVIANKVDTKFFIYNLKKSALFDLLKPNIKDDIYKFIEKNLPTLHQEIKSGGSIDDHVFNIHELIKDDIKCNNKLQRIKNNGGGGVMKHIRTKTNCKKHKKIKVSQKKKYTKTHKRH